MKIRKGNNTHETGLVNLARPYDAVKAQYGPVLKKACIMISESLQCRGLTENEYRLLLKYEWHALPPQALGLTVGWPAIHQTELLENWNKAMRQEKLLPIKPLTWSIRF